MPNGPLKTVGEHTVTRGAAHATWWSTSTVVVLGETT